MIELAASEPEIASATIFEDKCSENPRAIFRQDVMKAFGDHHNKIFVGRNLCPVPRRLLRKAD